MSGENPSDSDRTAETVDLIRNAQAGEVEAFERLFERYYLTVLEHVRRRLGPTARKDLESGDILNEAMIQAIRSFADFEMRSDQAFMRWFVGIVENRIRAVIRERRAVKRDAGNVVPLDHINAALSSNSLHLEPAADVTPPMEALERSEQEQSLLAAVRQLDETAQRIIHLRHAEERSWNEIAAEVGCPSADAARMIYVRAKAELARKLGRG